MFCRYQGRTLYGVRPFSRNFAPPFFFSFPLDKYGAA